jgi:acetyl-CoA acetyltransferase
MIPFLKPGRGEPYDRMGEAALRLALADAGISYTQVQQAFVGYVYGDSTAGQKPLYRVGMTGIPVFNVNNNCSSGSSALFLARQAVASGAVHCALALGFEQMNPGALGSVFSDRPDPGAGWSSLAQELHPAPGLPPALHFFGSAGAEYTALHGTRPETFAKIAEKARRHARDNERAIFRDPVSVEEIMAAPKMYGPLTRLQCCPPTCGAAAAILVSESFAKRLERRPTVRLRAQSMTTDYESTFSDRSMIKAIGYDLTRYAASQAFEQGGLGPEDLDVVELHDCFTSNELLSYEALGLTPEGTAERFIWDGDNTYGGRVVTNPSGGLLSKGHPLGATGLAQCTEIVEQLRGQCGPRQVEDARIGLQHNIGIGGACVVTIYERV